MKPRLANFTLLLAYLGLGGTGVATLLALFAHSGWMPELAAHFRVQYLVALVLLGLGFGALRRPRAALIATLLLVPNAWSVAPYLLPLAVTPSEAGSLVAGQEIRVVALNLLFSNENHAAVREYLQKSDADVLVLSELTPAWVSALRGVTAGYPYWLSLDRTHPWGLGLYSRYPLRGERITNLGLPGSVNVSARVALPGGDVEIMGVHLASPVTPVRAVRRNHQLARLAEALGTRPGGERLARPRLLVGDLNLTPYSPYYDDLLRATGMVDKRRGHGPIGTWPTWSPLLQIPIDHCIADPELEVTRVERGPQVGSDHYPLEIRLRRGA